MSDKLPSTFNDALADVDPEIAAVLDQELSRAPNSPITRGDEGHGADGASQRAAQAEHVQSAVQRARSSVG